MLTTNNSILKITRYALILIFLASSVASEAQIGKRLFETRRKQVEVPNYTLFLNLDNMALRYSTRIESTVDSLLNTGQEDYLKNIFDFRIRAIQTMQHVLYKSDPLIAYFDGWIFGMQMVAYLESPLGVDYLGPFQPSMLVLFMDYLAEWPAMHISITGENPVELEARFTSFANNNPITDNYLKRNSVVLETAQWVGESSIGFKSGVSTLTDAMRNISDRVNYYTEFSPKLTQWYIVQSVRELMGPDSIGPIVENMVSSVERISYTVDSLDHLIYSFTDTLLTDVDRQRGETLNFLSSERKAVLQHISEERSFIINQLIEERKSLEKFVHQERQASFEHMDSIIAVATDRGFEQLNHMTDRIFWRAFILTLIIIAGLILALVIYKRL